MRGATRSQNAVDLRPGISIHAPHAGRDREGLLLIRHVGISIHAPHAGRDQTRLTVWLWDPNFNPRAPCGARPFFNFTPIFWHCHFNPRAPCGARPPETPGRFTRMKFQSTRPMRGATSSELWRGCTSSNFNPRAPCGARPTWQSCGTFTTTFQSTRPMRGATVMHDVYTHLYQFQSTRPMRGATPGNPRTLYPDEISIHAPHAGRDILRVVAWMYLFKFQSTRPMRGATSSSSPSATLSAHFNPRAPCGARRSFPLPSTSQKRFQSTRPMRGATGSQND